MRVERQLDLEITLMDDGELERRLEYLRRQAERAREDSSPELRRALQTLAAAIELEQHYRAGEIGV